MTMKYQGIIFDFNGTLFFDNDKHERAWNEISKLLRNKDITEEELHGQLNGTPNVQNIRYLTDGKATPQQEEEYSLRKEEYYRKFCREDRKNFHLVSGTEEFFEKLKRQKIPFTIASASIKANIDFFVESFHLDQWMDPELIVYDDGTYENKIAMFQKAAKNIGVKMEDICIFEDSLSGIKNAYESGCRQIVVMCEKEKEQQYQRMSGVIKTIQDFQGVS